MKNLIVMILGLVLCSACSQTGTEDTETIRNLMHEQESAWNAGNIEGFMASYWDSDSLKFIGKNGLTYGWKNTLNNYKKNYPDKVTMGELHFSILSIEQVSEDACYAVGKWQLKRYQDDTGGYFSLLWKKIAGKWVIVADHTS